MDDSTVSRGRRSDRVRTGEATAATRTALVGHLPEDRNRKGTGMSAPIGFPLDHRGRIALLVLALTAPSSAGAEGAVLAAPQSTAPVWSDSYGEIEASRVATSEWVSGLSPAADGESAL